MALATLRVNSFTVAGIHYFTKFNLPKFNAKFNVRRHSWHEQICGEDAALETAL